MTLVLIITGLAAGCACLLGGLVLWRGPGLLANRLFAAGLVLLATECAFVGLSAAAATGEQVAGWQWWRLVVTALMPGVWLWFALVYSRGNHQEYVARWRWGLAASFALPLLVVMVASNELIRRVEFSTLPGEWTVVLGSSGKLLHICLLLGAVLVLVNLERTFRAAVGTMRWRIKLVVLGLGILLLVNIFTSSQVLVYGAVSLTLETVNAGALLVACGLIALSLRRTGRFAIDVYPSHAFLHRSLTAVLAGLYLVVVGALAEWSTVIGGDAAFPLKAFFLLVSLVVLTLLLLSDRAQEYTRSFVSRHLRRPRYDYRQVWQSFTEKTAACPAAPEFCQAVARWAAETFNVLSVTLWLVDESKRRLIFGASTALTDADATALIAADTDLSPVFAALGQKAFPVNVDQIREPWGETLRQFCPGYFEKGGSRVAVPLASGGELLGLMTLGDRVSGVPYAIEDFELLKNVGDQAGGGLLNLQLSRRLLEVREMQAFQTMSAFFVHDLKNTASTLSLMLQNLPRHFDNPEYRQDALRSLGKCVGHINDLIAQLGRLRRGLELHRQPAALHTVVGAALASLELTGQARLEKQLQPVPPTSLDAEQIGRVVTNLVLNAFDALPSGGEVRVETGERPGWVMLTVADNGQGMTPEFVRKSLFRPFQTTKQKGMGIGLFHSKMIVEAHGGKIEVESTAGQGTTFRVLLPAAAGS
jgi:putative PEP-CTERM system histidine kinase